jgi:gliding motility associated protien GldN
MEPDNQGRMNLYNILDIALKEGRIRGFKDDMFVQQIDNYEEYLASFATKSEETIETGEYDIDGMPMTKDTIILVGEINEADVKFLRIKEDWFIDRSRSVEDVRIIGFCLVSMAEKGPAPLAWIRYNDPEVRELLANSEVYNMDNDRARRSYDDIFRKRLFSSYIIRESNDFNRRIEDYASGIDAMMESQRIEDYLFEMEEDMWEY